MKHVLAKGLNDGTLIKKNNTFCHLLWERAFINEYGDVFFCCLCKPGPIGNIYKHDLAYIWQKSEKVKLFRKMSLNGHLSCYSNCIVLSKKEKEIGLGRYYRNQGKLIEAETSFKDALEVNPKNHEIHIELGWLYKELGRFSEAEASFKKALELEPRNSDACVGLGYLSKEAKRYTEAKELFEEALKINPSSFAAYAGLGWLYKGLGKLSAAEVSFKKALDLNSNTESACIGLGQLYKDQGNFNQAKQLLRKTAEFSLRIDYPRTLHILMGTFCPISCVMCPQDHSLKKVLNNNMLKKNIDWPRIDDIVMQGGEVLAISSAKEFYIWLTEKMQKKIKLVTNGLLINGEWGMRLVRGSEWIEVSVNAATRKTHESINRGSSFERVISNLKMLIDFKHSYNMKTDIRFHFTIVPEKTHEIAQAIKVAERLGCDLIAYSFDSPRVEIFLSQHKKIKKRITDEISKLTKGALNIKIQRNQLKQLGLVEGFDPNLVIEEY